MRQNIGNRVVEDVEGFEIASSDKRADIFQMLHVILRKILELDVLAGKSPGAVRTVKSECSSGTMVCTGNILHGDVLLHGGLGKLLPQGQNLGKFRRRILQKFQHSFFVERIRLRSMLR